MNKQTIISIITVVIVLVAALIFIQKADSKPGELDQFAMCIEESGATFYGAFWCPHCQNQKAAFGRKSAKLLPYVECSTPDGKGQTEVCTEANIEGYPTWEFADGERMSGEISLEVLSEKTFCPLPDSYAN